MKITITREFNTAGEAMEFLARVQGPSPAPAQPEPLAQPQVAVGQGQPAAKRPRKPRADAGQPRGEYRHRTTGGAGSPPAGATSPAPQASEPSTISAAPETGRAPQPQGAGSTARAADPAPVVPLPVAGPALPAQGSAAAAADLTLDAVRETMGKLYKIPGLGMEACIESLKAFGVLRVSDLPKEKYAAFDAHIRAQLPAAP